MAFRAWSVGAGVDGNFGALIDSVDQTAASRTDGWTVAKIAAGNSCEFDAATKQLSTSFTSETTTPKPASFLTGTTANAFKTSAALTEAYAASPQWALFFAVRATVGASQQGKLHVRVFKSVNASGASATELTTSTQISGPTVVSAVNDQLPTINWFPGAFALSNEFLFFVLAWEITTASSSNTADVQFRTGQPSAFTGGYVQSPTIVAAATIPDVGMALTVT